MEQSKDLAKLIVKKSTAKPAVIKSPCVGLCCLDDKDLCIACRRSGMEIAEWGIYTNEEKLEVLAKVSARHAEDEK